MIDSHLLDLYADLGWQQFQAKEHEPMTDQKFLVQIELMNTGWKTCKMGNAINGDPKKALFNLPLADLYLDCRVLPNPVFVSDLGPSGDDPRMQAWMAAQAVEYTNAFLQLIVDGLKQIESRRLGKEDAYAAPYRVCFLCAHGIHRSRSMKHIIARRLKQMGWKVEVK